jgi:hypothetical protein
MPLLGLPTVIQGGEREGAPIVVQIAESIMSRL